MGSEVYNSQKLSERMNRDGGHSTVYVPEVAALEQQLAAKDAEIARLKSNLSEILCSHIYVYEISDETVDLCSCGMKYNPRASTAMGQWVKHITTLAALAETPAAPREPRVILPPHVKQGFCDRHNRKWEEIDTGDGFAFTCRECRNERIKNHDAPLTALALPEDDVPDAASETEV